MQDAYSKKMSISYNKQWNSGFTLQILNSNQYQWDSGGRLNIKKSSYQYGDSHVKDKTVSWPSYL